MLTIDYYLLDFVLLGFVALTMALFFRFLKQPSVIAYIITGIIVGPWGLGIITNHELISHLGGFGVVLLLFFVGMQMQIPRMISKWRIAVIGTAVQILISVFAMLIIGYFLNWSVNRVVLLGFVISLSSTAVIVKLLEDRDEINTKTGQNVLSILLAQDLAVIVMLIAISLMNEGGINPETILLQALGFLMFIFFIFLMIKRRGIGIPLGSRIREDHELQVIAALIICFGMASLSGLFQLSTALGAFAAGILVSVTKEIQWAHNSLQPFRVVFLALFFASIGMLIDMSFVRIQFTYILLLVIMVFLTNTFINALIFRWFGESWKSSVYGGSFLAQIGEFSFVLATVGLNSSILSSFGYQITIATISISLMICPLWINLFRRVLASDMN